MYMLNLNKLPLLSLKVLKTILNDTDFIYLCNNFQGGKNRRTTHSAHQCM